MNKAQLIGNVGKDPEIRTTQGGGKVASFSVATSETWKDKDGNRKEKTEWHRVVVFSPGLVDIVEKYVKKGAKLYVEGQIASRKWTDKSGKENATTEIVIKGYSGSMELLDRKPVSATAAQDDAPSNEIYEDELAGEIAF